MMENAMMGVEPVISGEDDPYPVSLRSVLVGGAALGALILTDWNAQGAHAFATDSLKPLRSRLVRQIGAGFAPGMAGLIACGKDVETFVLGKMAFDGGADMRRDTIFRIASMTKPVTATAVMMLVEDSKLKLDEPVGHIAL